MNPLFCFLLCLAFALVPKDAYALSVQGGSRNVAAAKARTRRGNLHMDSNGDLNEETTGVEPMIEDAATPLDSDEGRRPAETDLIDEEEMHRIDILSNDQILQKMKQTYRTNSESEALVQQLKEILSRAFHITPKEVDLHDMNILLKKWRLINKVKYGNSGGGHANPNHRDINEHREFESGKGRGTLTWDIVRGYDNRSEETGSGKINVPYLLDLIK